MTTAAPSDASPWLHIWLQPRSTVRSVLTSRQANVAWLLAMASGISQTLVRAEQADMGARVPLPTIAIAAIGIGAIWGPVQILVIGGLVHWVGRRTGTHGSFRDLAIAFAWAGVPQVAILALWAVATIPFGGLLYLSVDSAIAAHAAPLVLAIGVLSLGTAILLLWWFVILIQAIAETQVVSAWRALGHLALATLILGVAILVALGVVVLSAAS